MNFRDQQQADASRCQMGQLLAGAMDSIDEGKFVLSQATDGTVYAVDHKRTFYRVNAKVRGKAARAAEKRARRLARDRGRCSGDAHVAAPNAARCVCGALTAKAHADALGQVA